MDKNKRVCCPYLEVLPHDGLPECKCVGCQIKGPLAGQDEIRKCISFGNWINCESFIAGKK